MWFSMRKGLPSILGVQLLKGFEADAKEQYVLLNILDPNHTEQENDCGQHRDEL